MAPQVGGEMFSVHLPIFNFKLILILKQHQIFKIFYFHYFYLSFKKTFYLQIHPKITKDIRQNSPEHRYVKRDICVETIAAQPNTAL